MRSKENKIYFPKIAIYRRKPNRLYSIWDFKDGDIVVFVSHCEKPSANAIGNAYYRKIDETISKLINVSELEAVEEEI